MAWLMPALDLTAQSCLISTDMRGQVKEPSLTDIESSEGSVTDVDPDHVTAPLSHQQSPSARPHHEMPVLGEQPTADECANGAADQSASGAADQSASGVAALFQSLRRNPSEVYPCSFIQTYLVLSYATLSLGILNIQS